MKIIKFVLLMLVLAVISACTTIHIPEGYKPDENPQDGVLVVSTSIPQFEETVGFSLLYHVRRISTEVENPSRSYASVHNLSDQRYFPLEVSQSGSSSDFTDADGKLHARPLRAGTYELQRWSMSTGYNMFIHPKELKPIRFTIKPGHITYLGNIHMNNSYGKNIFGIALARGGIVSFNDELDRDMAVFRVKRPAIDLMVLNQTPSEPLWLPKGMTMKDLLQDEDEN